MRLLLVTDSFGSGGAQRQLVQLARGLQEAGHDVEFFVYQPAYTHFRPVVEEAGIVIHTATKRGRYSPRVVGSLTRLVARGRYDGILAYLTTPAVYAETAARLAGLAGRRPVTIVSERGPLQRVGLPLRLALGVHHLADHVVTNSHNNREQLLAVWPSLRDRSSVIYNGIDLETFHPPPAWTPATHGAMRLLAIGTLLPYKDALTLVEALAAVRARLGWTPQVRWAGKLGDRGGDPAYERTVRERVATLGLEQQWEWLGERHDIPALLHSHDALVHPSVLEGLPNAVCEALASGLPVIASRIGDNAALVREGATGFLHEPGDPSSLADALVTFAAIPDDGRAAMRVAARAHAEDTLSLERCVREYESLFRRLR